MEIYKKVFILLAYMAMTLSCCSQVQVNLFDENNKIIGHENYDSVFVGHNPEINDHGALIVEHYSGGEIVSSNTFFLVEDPKENFYRTVHKRYGSVIINEMVGFHMLKFTFSKEVMMTYSGRGLKY